MLTDAQVRGAKPGDSPRKLFDERELRYIAERADAAIAATVMMADPR